MTSPTAYAASINPDQTTTAVDANLDHLVSIGVTMLWCSAAMEWLYSPGVGGDATALGKLEYVIDGAQLRGLPVTLQVHGTPTWISASGTWHGPNTTNERANWVSIFHDLMVRFTAQTAYFEVWNEPNLDAFWTQGANATEYARLLHDVYLDAKALDPTCTIVGHNMSQNHLGWLQAVYTAMDTVYGVPTCSANRYFFDVLGIHPYAGNATSGYNPSDESHADISTAFGVLDPDFLGYRRLRTETNTREGTAKSVAFGEFGYTTTSANWFFVVEATRQTYLSTAYNLARGDGVLYLSFYLHDNSVTGGGFNWHGTGTETAYTASSDPWSLFVAPVEVAGDVDYGPGMRYLSGRGLASLSRSGARSARVDVLRDGQLVRRIDSNDPSIRILGGSVQVDRATIRRSGTVTLQDTSGTLLPDDVNDLLAPLIGELRIWCGIRYYDWTEAERATGRDWEWVPVGTLVVMEIAAAGRHAYTVSCLDRMQFLQPFPHNYAIPAGTVTAQALLALLSSFIPSSHLATNIPAATEHTTGALLYEEGADSAEVAHSLALAMGLSLFADPMGVICAAPEPTTEDPPAVTFSPGAASVMMRPQRGVSASGAVNAVTFTGEAPDGQPVRGYAEDQDALSLSYIQRVGPRPAPRQSSPLLLTNAQCDLAARTWLQRNLGLVDTTAVPIVPNPALDSGDVIRVVDPDQALDATLIVDSMSISLRASDGDQTLTCRARVLR